MVTTLAPWRNISVEPGELSWNRDGRPLWRRCNWCGGVGIWVVTRTSNLTDNVYSDYACDACADGWRS